MHDTTAEHPDLAQLRAFDQGRVGPTEWDAIDRHVRDCPACARRVEGLPEQRLADLLCEYDAGRGTDAPTAAPETPPVGPPPAAAPADPEVPAELTEHPRYRLLGVLGAGGMGKVFKAEHRLMGRLVALKVIHPHLLGGGAVERFRQEARAAAQLAHPNIVTAYDAEQAGAAHFLVMEHVAGETLDLLLERRGPLPVAEACDLVRQAALGLQHAHEHGMVHRDLKPSNLIATAAGQVKILDFGLAQLNRQRQDRPALTPEGVVVGTPAYLAPEQARDPRGADIRADLYSLGCTLYHLLAGRPPFPEGTLLQQLLAHQDRTPRPLSAFRRDVPPALAQLVEVLLAKDPARRLQTPAELAVALAPFAADKGPGTGRGALSRRRVALALAAVLAAGVAVGAWYLATRGGGTAPDDKPPQGPAAVKAPTGGEPWTTRPPARDQAVAWVKANNRFGPDHVLVEDTGRQIAAKVDGGKAFLLWLGQRLVRSAKPTLLAGRHHDLSVFEFSPKQVGPWLPEATTSFYVTAAQSQEYHPRQLVRLSYLRIDPDSVGRGRTLTGSVTCTRLAPVPGPVALRLTYVVGQETRSGYMVFEDKALPRATVIRLSFPPLLDKKEPWPREPVVALLELGLWHEGARSKIAVVSNALAVALLQRDQRVVTPTARAGPRDRFERRHAAWAADERLFPSFREDQHAEDRRIDRTAGGGGAAGLQ